MWRIETGFWINTFTVDGNETEKWWWMKSPIRFVVSTPSFWFWDRYRSQFHGGIIHIHPVWNEWRGTEKTEGKYLKFRWGRIHMRWTLLCSLVAMATSLISTSYVNSWLISHTLWNVHSSSSIALNIHSSFLGFGFWVLGFGFWVLGFWVFGDVTESDVQN